MFPSGFSAQIYTQPATQGAATKPTAGKTQKKTINAYEKTKGNLKTNNDLATGTTKTNFKGAILSSIENMSAAFGKEKTDSDKTARINALAKDPIRANAFTNAPVDISSNKISSYGYEKHGP